MKIIIWVVTIVYKAKLIMNLDLILLTAQMTKHKLWIIMFKVIINWLKMKLVQSSAALMTTESSICQITQTKAWKLLLKIFMYRTFDFHHFFLMIILIKIWKNQQKISFRYFLSSFEILNHLKLCINRIQIIIFNLTIHHILMIPNVFILLLFSL